MSRRRGKPIAPRVEVFCERGHEMISVPVARPDAERVALEYAAELGCGLVGCTAPPTVTRLRTVA